jgi:hypothetical protein
MDAWARACDALRIAQETAAIARLVPAFCWSWRPVCQSLSDCYALGTRFSCSPAISRDSGQANLRQSIDFTYLCLEVVRALARAGIDAAFWQARMNPTHLRPSACNKYYSSAKRPSTTVMAAGSPSLKDLVSVRSRFASAKMGFHNSDSECPPLSIAQSTCSCRPTPAHTVPC